MQRTLTSPVTFRGFGLHTGRPVRMTIHPGAAEFGVWFRRTDISSGDTLIPARWDMVDPNAQLCTRIVNADGAAVATVEHVMAALAGLGVYNALIEIDGPEVPVLDGSSEPYVRGLLKSGLRTLAADVRAVEILKPVEVSNGPAKARLEPANGLQIDFEIDFTDRAIGHQQKSLSMTNGAFVRELCDSRTFCRSSDIDAMHKAGLALGGTYENAVVVDDDQVLSPGGLRHGDEPVRHKMLDALGDLAMAGVPILGRYVGVRSGHAMTNQLLRAVFAQPDAFRMVVCDAVTVRSLPGMGVTKRDLALSA
ncbi:MAG: UDP-3-O-acyl-N-acetylglucosamine deacetylase [Mangrovicoccus sp.]